MKYNKKADLLTIGQWIENNICFGTFEEPLTSNRKYKEIGDKFIKYLWGFTEYSLLHNKPELFDYKVHTVMKQLISYRLTPHAIAFAYKYQNELAFKDKDAIIDIRFTKSVIHLSDKALCKFRITIQPSQKIECVNMHTRDYFSQYPNEKIAIEIDGLESIEKGAGGNLVRNAISVLNDVPVLLQAGFLHYGDYECDKGLERVERLVSFYESLGFENINDTIGNYEESVMMLAHKDKIRELEEDREV